MIIKNQDKELILLRLLNTDAGKSALSNVVADYIRDHQQATIALGIFRPISEIPDDLLKIVEKSE